MIDLRGISARDWATFKKNHPRAYADLMEASLRGQLGLLRSFDRKHLNPRQRKRLDELEVWDRMRQIRETDTKKAG